VERHETTIRSIGATADAEQIKHLFGRPGGLDGVAVRLGPSAPLTRVVEVICFDAARAEAIAELCGDTCSFQNTNNRATHFLYLLDGLAPQEETPPFYSSRMAVLGLNDDIAFTLVPPSADRQRIRNASTLAYLNTERLPDLYDLCGGRPGFNGAALSTGLAELRPSRRVPSANTEPQAAAATSSRVRNEQCGSIGAIIKDHPTMNEPIIEGSPWLPARSRTSTRLRRLASRGLAIHRMLAGGDPASRS
jgi:hypothetical protein